MQGNQDDFASISGAGPDSSRSIIEEAQLPEGRRSRRSFLKRTAVATAAPAVILAGASTGLGATTTTAKLPYLNDPNWVKSHIQGIINNETQHLQALLTELGNYARPKPSFQNITATSLTQFVTMGSLFCSTGAGAYLGATPYIANPYLMNQAGSIGQVELTQSGYLNTLLDQPFLTGGSPYALSLTLQNILDRAAPYVSSLNGGPVPSFSTTVMSLENDIAIFNVALILEYLEVEFYTTNFPIFFP